jgi:Tol biopolymer transport system component
MRCEQAWRSRRASRSATVVIALLTLGAHDAPALAAPGDTERVSVRPGGGAPNWSSDLPSTSATGRFVAFLSGASDLVPGDTNNADDVFVRDRQTGTVERVSVADDDAQANGGSAFAPSISADGTLVAFTSLASNLVPGDANAHHDVFVRDRAAGSTERVSVASNGAEADNGSLWPVISADGSTVAFRSLASNLDPTHQNPNTPYNHLFVHDRDTGTTELVDVSTTGGPGSANCCSTPPAISGDGNLIAFDSGASNLASGFGQVYLRDVAAQTTTVVSVSTAGALANAGALEPSISADGRYVAFRSSATNLVARDTNNSYDIFVRDRAASTTERVSVAADGAQANGNSYTPSISTDWRASYVAFNSSATNLVAGDTNGVGDIFVRDRFRLTTTRASVASDGTEADLHALAPSISADGRFVAFSSAAGTLTSGAGYNSPDVFIHELVPPRPELPPPPPECYGELPTITGTARPDEIVGTAGRDVILALGGNDVIVALGGSDLICGGAGADVINGGANDDKINAGPGLGEVWGERGDDQISGSAGTVRGGDGDDRIIMRVVDQAYGGPGHDRLQCCDTVAGAYLHGGPGNDVMLGGLGPDQLVGAEGDDDLYGSLRGDRVYGSQGSDRVAGGPDPAHEDDECHGGPNVDSLWRAPFDQRRHGCEVVHLIP